MRQAARRDRVEDAIVRALRDIGVVVLRLNGPGCPDLLTYSRGMWLPLEIKSGSAAKLTLAQQHTHRRAPFVVVRSVAEALAVFGVKT